MKMKKNKINMEYPRYKRMIPLLICAYMIVSLFINGIDNKSVLLTVASTAIILYYIGERIFPDNVYKESRMSISKWIYILTGSFLLMSIISQLLSKDYSYMRLIGEGESLINVFCYIVLFYMGCRYGYEEKNQKIIKVTIILLSALTAVMSLIEFFDIPLAILWVGNIESLEAKNRVILSFGNSNYYGVFCCMLLSFITRIWIITKDKAGKIFFIVLNTILICCVCMSKSTMALALMIFVVGGTLLYDSKSIFSQWKYILLFFIMLFFEILFLNICSGGAFIKLVNIGMTNNDAFIEAGDERYIINDISLDENCLVITGEDSKLIIEYSNQFTFYDENMNVLDIKSEDNIIRFIDEPYNQIELEILYNKVQHMMLVEVDAGYKESIDFYIDNGIFKGVGADGKPVDDISGKYTESKINNLFTGRGYIWINTISMIDEVVFIGKGFGNYINVFKQYDYVGLLKSQGTTNIIIDRPHNMFLQYCIDIGLIGTVAIFCMLIFILISWLKQNLKCGRDERILSLSTFFSIIIFLIFAMLNDSLVVLSPYMWIFLGINVSMQYSRNK